VTRAADLLDTQVLDDAVESGETLGVAVSGGSDSTGLLLLLSQWAKTTGVVLKAITVNHGLREEAQAEALQVGRQCAGQNIDHQIVALDATQRTGNLQDWARRERSRAISNWAQAGGFNTVALGHTQDDQAETFLQRLARGSGVDGLSAMKSCVLRNNIRWLRPLLRATRDDVRQYLTDRNFVWSEDPSNQDPRYSRVAMRQILPSLSTVGINSEVIGQTTQRLASAQRVLKQATHDLARQTCQFSKAGSVQISANAFECAEFDLKLRLLSHALGWVAGHEYKPRAASVATAMSNVQHGTNHSIGGCLIVAKKDCFHVVREYEAVKSTKVVDGTWDGRWVSTDHDEKITALGEKGLAQITEWRRFLVPRQGLLSMPAVWKGDVVEYIPLEIGENPRLLLKKDEQDFFSSILSH
jgi:tRNA(Ile)-lysidine synthase